MKQPTNRIGVERLWKNLRIPVRTGHGTTWPYPVASGFKTQKYSLSLNSKKARLIGSRESRIWTDWAEDVMAGVSPMPGRSSGSSCPPARASEAGDTVAPSVP